MSRLEQDRAAALEASRVSQAQAKRENAKHTPGPWLAKPTGPWDGWDGWSVEDASGSVVCDAHGSQLSGTREANARLIAGAPEMLEALKAYEAWADKTICKDVELSGIRKQIRAAIARATGEQHDPNAPLPRQLHQSIRKDNPM